MKQRHSFTALELVMVITIAAILLSISIPAFYNISAGRRLTGALTAIAANISLARSEAVSSNNYVALIFNPDGDAMRLARLHKITTPAYTFLEWLDGSSWEKIEEGVVIPATSDNSNFYEGTSETAPTEITSVDFSDLGGGASVSTDRAIIFNPRGQIITKGSEVTPIVIRAAEGTKVPGGSSYVLKKTDTKVTYGRLTVNPLSCRTEVDYVSE